MPDADMAVEQVPLADLKAHPDNYRTHPQEQLDHLAMSLQRHGFYRAVVVARDNTILAGHGIVQAAQQAGFTEAPVVRLDLDSTSTAALKVLAGDNELGRLAESDERKLADILRLVQEDDEHGLDGTGYDDSGLADLLRLTTPPPSKDEVDDPYEHWGGMPEYHQDNLLPCKQLAINFKTPEDLQAFAALVEQNITMAMRSIWYPAAERIKTIDIGYAAVGDES
jgi:hypothetical protein